MSGVYPIVDRPDLLAQVSAHRFRHMLTNGNQCISYPVGSLDAAGYKRIVVDGLNRSAMWRKPWVPDVLMLSHH